jgi:hypothetical protein
MRIPITVLVGLLLLVALAWTLATGGRVRAGDPHRYRPRQRHGKAPASFDDAAFAGEAGADGPQGAGEAPTDFLTGAALDPDGPVVRCEDCRALYHPDTAAMLREHNAGACASCGGTALRPVGRHARRAHDAPRPGSALVAEPSTPEAWSAAIGRAASATGLVLRDPAWQPRGAPSVVVRDDAGVELRVILLGEAGRGLRGHARALGLLGSRVRVRGLLLRDEAIGLRLLVTDPAMVRELDD